MTDITSCRLRSEQGSATVLVAGLCAVVLVLGSMAVMVASAVHASARARTAADLSALAGATARFHQLLGNSEVDPCSVAETVAAGNGAALTVCAVDDAVNVTVRVSVAADGGLSLTGLPAATASARAGPASTAP
ncbi:MAG: Rv3654c family TadE-like protein [Dermatophilaceae bacterium]